MLLDVDVPWVDDLQRFLPNERRQFFDRCRQTLEQAGRQYQVIRGTWSARFAAACRAVQTLLDDERRL